MNTGKQRHEANLQLLRKGGTLRQFMEVDKKGGDVDSLVEAGLGVLHTVGGTTPHGLLRVELLPGREYLIECGFTDTDKSPPHYALGMIGSIRVAPRSR